MDLVLNSPRLRLTPFAESDFALAVDLFTDPRVMKHICEAFTAEEILKEAPITMRRGGGGSIGIWCVALRETGEQLGTTMLLPLPIESDDTDWDLVEGPDLPPGEIELGYFLKPEAWGRGYASEIARTLLEFAFKQTPMQEIVAVINPNNDASRNVLLKSGLTETGPRRAYAEDMIGFQITRDQWRCQTPSNDDGKLIT